MFSRRRISRTGISRYEYYRQARRGFAPSEAAELPEHAGNLQFRAIGGRIAAHDSGLLSVERGTRAERERDGPRGVARDPLPAGHLRSICKHDYAALHGQYYLSRYSPRCRNQSCYCAARKRNKEHTREECEECEARGDARDVQK
jgi:hypothetical protein